MLVLQEFIAALDLAIMLPLLLGAIGFLAPLLLRILLVQLGRELLMLQSVGIMKP